MWGMLGAACILLSGVGPPPTPCWGSGAALGCLREADCLGAVGGPGASGLGRCRLPQAPFLRGSARSAPSAPRGRGGRGAGGGPAAGLLFAPGRISPRLARPAYLHLCLLQAVHGWQTQTRSLLARLRQEQYWPLMTIINHCTWRCAARRPSTCSSEPADASFPPEGQWPAASLSLAGSPGCSPDLPRSCPAPSLGMEATSSALEWGDG